MSRVLRIQLALSGVGVIAGLLAFITFFFFYHNHSAGTWALLSAIFALAFFHMVWLYKNGRLLQWHDANSLNGIIDFSFVMFVVSIAVMVWYIFKTIYYQETVYSISDSSQITAVWSFMTAKWTGGLWYSCHAYKTEFNLR